MTWPLPLLVRVRSPLHSTSEFCIVWLLIDLTHDYASLLKIGPASNWLHYLVSNAINMIQISALFLGFLMSSLLDRRLMFRAAAVGKVHWFLLLVRHEKKLAVN